MGTAMMDARNDNLDGVGEDVAAKAHLQPHVQEEEDKGQRHDDDAIRAL